MVLQVVVPVKMTLSDFATILVTIWEHCDARVHGAHPGGSTAEQFCSFDFMVRLSSNLAM
jgi:hypothetical protein